MADLNLSEQEIVRRNKLEKYKELGLDPRKDPSIYP